MLKLDPLRPLKWTRSRKWFVDNNNGLHRPHALVRLETECFPLFLESGVMRDSGLSQESVGSGRIKTC